jgi:predicted acetyltransferase
MAFEIRPITHEEFTPFATQLEHAFGHAPNPEVIEHFRQVFEFDRSLAAFDGSRIVGTAGIDSFELTLPGLTRVPAAGVTAVTVAPTHRRRGILTSMMRQQLRDVRERGEPVAMLLASESVIYGRYGYGLATHQVELQARSRDPLNRLTEERHHGSCPKSMTRFAVAIRGASIAAISGGS